MKKLLFIIVLLAGGLLPSCQKVEVEPYSHKNGVYFFLADIVNSGGIIYTRFRDTLTFSFVKLDESQVEAVVPVRVNLQGIPENHDRKFVIKVNKERSTAVEGTDYVPLAPQYVIAANEYYTLVPVTVKRTPALRSQSLNIVFELEETEDLELGIRERQTLVIKFADMVTKPSYWDYYLGSFMGDWSQTKHLLIERLCNIEILEEWPTADAMAYNQFLYAGSYVVNTYVGENIVIDDDGTRLLPWK